MHNILPTVRCSYWAPTIYQHTKSIKNTKGQYFDIHVSMAFYLLTMINLIGLNLFYCTLVNIFTIGLNIPFEEFIDV
jgi:hypothetical protein